MDERDAVEFGDEGNRAKPLEIILGSGSLSQPEGIRDPLAQDKVV